MKDTIHTFYYPTIEYLFEHVFDNASAETFIIRDDNVLARVTSSAEMLLHLDGAMTRVGCFFLRQEQREPKWDFKYLDRSGTEVTFLIGDRCLLSAERTAFKHFVASGWISTIPAPETLSGPSESEQDNQQQ